MAKLKLGPIADDKPVKVTVELPAGLHRDLTAYAEILGRESRAAGNRSGRLIVPMLERFIATDRASCRTPSTARTENRKPGMRRCQP
jgi:hypothetical protein